MGRNSSGKITTSAAQRLELSYLFKAGYIRKGCKISGSLSWNNGSSIRINSEFTEEKQFIRLAYQLKNESGEIQNLDYQIRLDSIPSNLGKGEIYYFICPRSGSRSRILYRCYGSPLFMGRKSYFIRIFYPSQICSKKEYNSSRYWEVEKILEKCYQAQRKSHYQGKETRLLKRINFLEGKKKFLDYKRFLDFGKYCQKKGWLKL
jgi:hypothetical protein